jgi:hypothetical protein
MFRVMSDRDVKAAEAERRRKRGQEALREPLGKWDGWRIIAQCPSPSCPRPREIPISDLADELGNAVIVGSVVRRLVCGKCRLPPNWVTLAHHVARYPLLGDRPASE